MEIARAELSREALFPMGKKSRTKGHSFERQIAAAFRTCFPNAKRQLEYQIDTCEGVDLANTGPFRVQCKKLKKYASVATIGEVECDRTMGEIPVLVTAGDFEEPMAVLPLDSLLWLLDFLPEEYKT